MEKKTKESNNYCKVLKQLIEIRENDTQEELRGFCAATWSTAMCNRNQCCEIKNECARVDESKHITTASPLFESIQRLYNTPPGNGTHSLWLRSCIIIFYLIPLGCFTYNLKCVFTLFSLSDLVCLPTLRQRCAKVSCSFFSPPGKFKLSFGNIQFSKTFKNTQYSMSQHFTVYESRDHKGLSSTCPLKTWELLFQRNIQVQKTFFSLKIQLALFTNNTISVYRLLK